MRSFILPIMKEVLVKCTRCHNEIRMNEQASEAFHGGQPCNCGGRYTVRNGKYAERHDQRLLPIGK